MTFWEALFADDESGRHFLSVPDGREWRQMSWISIVKEAETYAHGLRSRGVGPGSIVGTVLTNSPESVAGLLGIWLAGATVASLPVPARGMDLPDYGAQLRALAERFQDRLIVTDDAIAGLLDTTGDETDAILGWGKVRGGGRLADTPPAGDDVAFLQYSSGSTSAPKGCMLSANAIEAQVDLIVRMMDATPCDEVGVSWLPLSHDMGLFGCLLPACAYGGDLFLSSPERFIRSPRTWFEDCMETGATMTAGPDLALRVAARAAPTVRSSLPLRLEHIVVGAEPIHMATLDAAFKGYADAGLREKSFLCAYGMAEATLAVTAIHRDEAPSAVDLEKDALATGVVELVTDDTDDSISITCVGRPLDNVSVALAPGPRGALSEILVRSTSLASGYFEEPERSAAQFVDGAFHTGDLGFMHEGRLYVVGRLDDMISINGRNVYASEVEAAMASLDAIRRGCCTIVDVRREREAALVALVEVVDESADLQKVAAKMSRVAARVAGMRLDECLFLPKGGLPKTPSGKIQRYRSRALAMNAELEVGTRVLLA